MIEIKLQTNREQKEECDREQRSNSERTDQREVPADEEVGRSEEKYRRNRAEQQDQSDHADDASKREYFAIPTRGEIDRAFFSSLVEALSAGRKTDQLRGRQQETDYRHWQRNHACVRSEIRTEIGVDSEHTSYRARE